MKILVADRFEPSGLDGLKAAGCDVLYHPDLQGDQLGEALGATQADVLVVRSTKVTEAMLDAGRLSLIVRAGAGYNTIDVAAASRRGIYVSNCPGRNAVAVAELTLGLMLALDRRIPDNVAELRAGRWNKKEFSIARGLHGRTLGLLGMGSIGREVARRAAAFGMHLAIWTRRFSGEDRPLTDEDTRVLGMEPVRGVRAHLAPTPGDTAARSDILSVHVALAPETRSLVNAGVLSRLAQGAMFINTARAEVVDYAALRTAVAERGLRVALDVFDAEPSGAVAEFRDPIVDLPGVYGTHHIGASTDQAQEAIAQETVRVIRTFADTGHVPNVVNLARKTPATHMLIVRHRDRPGVLAHVFGHLRGNNVNVQETENVVFEGAEAAVARINLDRAPSEDVLETIRGGNPDILDLQLVTIQ
jgi:D-3-phosphoglycerate dehydrogenase